MLSRNRFHMKMSRSRSQIELTLHKRAELGMGGCGVSRFPSFGVKPHRKTAVLAPLESN